MDLELRTLRMLAEVVRQGGFSQAAKALHTSQSTVSKAVKQLENDCGLVILDRLPKGIRLTSAGELLHRRALGLLAQAGDLSGELDELRGLRHGVLRLGVPVVGSEILFAAPLAEFRRRFPGIEVRLTEQGSKRLEEMVQAGELDLAGALLPAPRNLAWRELRREPIDLVVPADHPLARAKQVRFRDVAGLPFILYAPGFALNPIILKACRRNRFTPPVAAQTSQVGLAVALVAAKMGVAFLPRMIARERAHPAVRCLPIGEPEIFWHMALIWRRDAYLSPEAKAWMHVLDGQAASGS